MTAAGIQSYMQIFSRFGLTWHRKVNFSTFSGKLTFQSTRNGLQNLPFCPGSLQDTFIICSSMSHQHIFSKIFFKKIENWKFKKTRTGIWIEIRAENNWFGQLWCHLVSNRIPVFKPKNLWIFHGGRGSGRQKPRLDAKAESPGCLKAAGYVPDSKRFVYEPDQNDFPNLLWTWTFLNL